MPFTVQPDPDALKQASLLAWLVELIDVRPRRWTAELLIDRELPGDLLRGPLFLDTRHETSARLNDERSRLTAEVRFHADATAQPGRSASPETPADAHSKDTIRVARCELDLQLAYAVRREPKQPISKGALDHFADLNAVYHAWPYWRAFLQDAMARLSVPNVVAPVLRMDTMRSWAVLANAGRQAERNEAQDHGNGTRDSDDRGRG